MQDNINLTFEMIANLFFTDFDSAGRRRFLKQKGTPLLAGNLLLSAIQNAGFYAIPDLMSYKHNIFYIKEALWDLANAMNQDIEESKKPKPFLSHLPRHRQPTFMSLCRTLPYPPIIEERLAVARQLICVRPNSERRVLFSYVKEGEKDSVLELFSKYALREFTDLLRGQIVHHR